MKRILVLFAVVLAAISLVACGSGAPGWIMNPDSDPEVVIARLEDEGWEVDSWNDGTTVIIQAFKLPSNFDEVSEDTVVTVYSASLAFFEDEASAALYKTMMDIMLEAMTSEIPEGMSLDFEIAHNGSIVSIWMRARGPAGDIDF